MHRYLRGGVLLEECSGCDGLFLASHAARTAARQACMQEAQKVVDPTARRRVEALCPSAK